MDGLLIIGAGGHGKVVGDAAHEMGHWERIAFLDDRYGDLKSILQWDVLGKIEDARRFLKGFRDLVVAVGNNRLRVELLHNFAAMGFSLPAIVHPSAVVSTSAAIDAGSVVFAGSVLNPGVLIGFGAIVNTGATVDHDCVLGAGVHLSPGVHIAGEVKVGRYSWLGIGASVIQGIAIGERAIVGAGAVVLKDVPAGVSVAGVPARIIKNFGIADAGEGA